MRRIVVLNRFGTVIQNAMRILPSIPIQDENGEYAGPTGNAEWNGNALNWWLLSRAKLSDERILYVIQYF